MLLSRWIDKVIVIPSILMTVVLNKSTTVTTARSVQVAKPAIATWRKSPKIRERERLFVKIVVQSLRSWRSVQWDCILHQN